VSGYYVVALIDGRAEIIETDDPNGITLVCLGAYASLGEAEQRRDIENDPYKRALFASGKLRVTNSN
jgi:hypothetical protein